MTIFVDDILNDPELLAATWDIEPLVDNEGTQGVEDRLTRATTLTTEFVKRYRGTLATISPSDFHQLIEELVEITTLLIRAHMYAMLWFAADTSDSKRVALQQKASESAAAIESELVFFDIEWMELDDEHASTLLAQAKPSTGSHMLAAKRKMRQYRLSEGEEKMLAATAVTRQQNWQRLWHETIGGLKIDVPTKSEPVGLDSALANLQDPDREIRRKSAEGITAALGKQIKLLGSIYNTIVQDKAVEDRLRKYPTWLSERHLSNEVSEASFEALIESVKGKRELAQRWYRLKAKLLGVERIADYDRSAPVSSSAQQLQMKWGDARETVLSAFNDFSPDFAQIAQKFFEENRIDAPERSGKRLGGFCAFGSPDTNPYILMNYTGDRRDILTLAHELGHGVHAKLGAEQGILDLQPGLTMCETASVFGERLVLDKLLEQTQDPALRLSLLGDSIDGAVATSFRQLSMLEFEGLAHNARREHGELSVEQLNGFWEQAQASFFADSMKITAGYRSWWSYIPHFIDNPGYVYAYSYGHLVALALKARSDEEGKSFAPKYLDLLRAGGSKSPEDLGAIAGIDLAQPTFWQQGLTLIERELDEAEAIVNSMK